MPTRLPGAPETVVSKQILRRSFRWMRSPKPFPTVFVGSENPCPSQSPIASSKLASPTQSARRSECSWNQPSLSPKSS
jgi:hypothetical protein